MSSQSPPRKISGRKPLRRPDPASILTPEKSKRNENSPNKTSRDVDHQKLGNTITHECSVEDNVVPSSPREKRHKSRKQKKETMSPSQRTKRKHESRISGEEVHKKRKREKKRQKSIEPKKPEIESPSEMFSSLSELDEPSEESRYARSVRPLHREYKRSTNPHIRGIEEKFYSHSSSRSPSMYRHSSHHSDYHSPSPRRKRWSRDTCFMRPPTSGGIYRPPTFCEISTSDRLQVDAPTKSKKCRGLASPGKNDQNDGKFIISEISNETRVHEAEKTVKKASSSSSSRPRGAIPHGNQLPEASVENILSTERSRSDDKPHKHESREKSSKSQKKDISSPRKKVSKSPKQPGNEVKSIITVSSESRKAISSDKDARIQSDRDGSRIIRDREKNALKLHRSSEKHRDSKKRHSHSRSMSSSRSQTASCKPEHSCSTSTSAGGPAFSTSKHIVASPSKFPTKRESLPKFHPSSAVSNSLTQIIGMLHLEETSDAELEDLLAGEILSGETAKLSMPPRIMKVVGIPANTESGEYLKDGRLVEPGDLPKNIEVASPSKKPLDVEICESSGIYSSLSNKLQNKLMSVETWDDDVDTMDLEFLSEDNFPKKSDQDLDPEEVTTLAASNAIRDIICLASTSAGILSTQRKILSSLSTPWQEIDSGCEEKENISSYSSITEKAIGVRTLALTGFSRRYLGESLTKELEAKLASNGNSSCQIGDHDLDNLFAASSSSSSVFGSIFSRHPIAMLHRRCVVNRLDSVAPECNTTQLRDDLRSIPVLSPIPPTQFMSQWNHPKVPTILGELSLRRHLLCLTSY